MNEVIIRVNDITKIRRFDDNIVVYTKDKYWVCDSTQRFPNANDVFLTLKLANKERSDEQ